MQSIMNANNFSSDHIETYKHAVTHAHIITHLFFFLKSRAVPHCFSVAVLSFRRAEVLHTDSDTDFVPLATLSDYRKVGPHGDSTSSGVRGGGVDFSAGLEV